MASSIALFPKTNLYAEVSESLPSRKPIYDDFEPAPPAPASAPAPSGAATSSSSSSHSSPSPTDRLAVQVGKTRLFLHAYVATAEARLNAGMASLLDLESSFTGTLASLAPPRSSGERLMPGALYVLVAAMAGSIVARNRNVLVRAAFPLAVGIGAGWVVLPVTMANVAGLTWEYEKRWPALADGHLRAGEALRGAWRMAEMHGEQAVRIVDEKVSEGRAAVEDWVRRGK